MDDLIEALNLAGKYFDSYGLKYPTGCDHDVLWLNLDVSQISEQDLRHFEALSFAPSKEYGGALISYKFGSC